MPSATDTELAYAAGLIDGEGCIDVHVDNRNRGMYPRVRVEMTHRDSVVWLHWKFGGQKPGVVHRTNRKHSSTARWSIQGRAALLFVASIRPYLKAKSIEADILLRFSGLERNPGKPVDDETLRRRIEIHAALRAEKTKGKGKIKNGEFFVWQKRTQDLPQ